MDRTRSFWFQRDVLSYAHDNFKRLLMILQINRLAAPAYKNKLRLRTDKLDRIVYFLTTPDAKSREKDRSDAQAKHQAGQW